MTFAETCLMVFRSMGYTESDIEEAKQVIREAWAIPEMKMLWVNWIKEQAKGLQ